MDKEFRRDIGNVHTDIKRPHMFITIRIVLSSYRHCSEQCTFHIFLLKYMVLK